MSAAAIAANPCILPPPNVKSRPYHAFPFLAVFHPKYGKRPRFTAFYLENCVKQPPVFSAYGNNMPVLYRLVDEKNNINQLIEIKLRAPPLKSVWGISSGPKKGGDGLFDASSGGPGSGQQQPKEKPRFTLSLAYDTQTDQGSAYFELRKDLDELALAWAKEDGGKWYANVPEEVKMGSFTVPKQDFIAGMFMGVTRERVVVNQATKERRTYAAQENHAVKQKNGKFAQFITFDAAGMPIDPLSITRDALVQSLSLTKGLYFMPKQWGWSIELVQAQKLADGVLTECIVNADQSVGATPLAVPETCMSAAHCPSAFEEDGNMAD
jgi:hypothetical protein